jgi:hypothetical protein
MGVTAGQALRDAGIQQVLEFEPSDWKEAYQLHVQSWFGRRPSGHTFTGETLRMVAKHCGLGEPHHHNAWSGQAASLIKRWLKQGLIELTGDMRLASSPKTHAHALREYRKT